MIVVLSDFGSEEPIGLWRRAARRHDAIALRIVNPLEESLPAAGLLSLEDAETGKTLVIDASSKRQRADYAQKAGGDASRPSIAGARAQASTGSPCPPKSSRSSR